MGYEYIGLTYLSIGLFLIAINIPIGIALGLVSFVGIVDMLSEQAAVSMIISAPYN